jgi:hypothetical protein
MSALEILVRSFVRHGGYKMRLSIAALVMMALPGFADAQHQHNQTPYAGLQQRSIKALSDQQIADLRAGRGMGLALAGELNGYPGPLHVLELADQLQLTQEQRQRLQQLFDTMKAEAVAVGERLIEQESRQFADRRISPDSLARLTAQIGDTQGQLRAIHLKYHLKTADLHEVTLVQNTKLFALIGEPTLSVNSFHREAVGQLSKAVVVSARCDDGTIEAIEVPSQRFALGLQWHQELFAGTDHPGNRVFRGLIEACHPS